MKMKKTKKTKTWMRNYRVIMRIIAGFIYEIVVDNSTFARVGKQKTFLVFLWSSKDLCVYLKCSSFIYRPTYTQRYEPPKKQQNIKTLTEIKKKLMRRPVFFVFFSNILKSSSFWCGVNLIFRKRHQKKTWKKRSPIYARPVHLFLGHFIAHSPPLFI